MPSLLRLCFLFQSDSLNQKLPQGFQRLKRLVLFLASVLTDGRHAVLSNLIGNNLFMLAIYSSSFVHYSLELFALVWLINGHLGLEICFASLLSIFVLSAFVSAFFFSRHGFGCSLWTKKA